MANLDKIYQDMQKCSRCRISHLSVNCKDISKGYGKLIGKGPGDKFLLILQNPSIRRFSNCESPVDDNDKGIGLKFRNILEELGLWKDCFVTNLVKCSTNKNYVPSSDEVDNCFEILQAEISLLRPKKIIAFGRFTYEVLTQYYTKDYYGDVYYIPHPSYYFHYNPHKISEFKRKLKETLR
ncbi:MAG: uracil-DNA glycosylase family protein [Candidatus Hodarchaeota archaeon]